MYQVLSSRITTAKSTGNEYKRATLKDEQGKVYEDVAIFNFNKELYQSVEEGNVVGGTIKEEPYKGKITYSLQAEATSKGAYQGKAEKDQAIISKGVKEAQERAKDSYQYSGTARDATIILAELMRAGQVEDWQAKWKEIRNWLFNRYYEDQLPDDVPFTSNKQ